MLRLALHTSGWRWLGMLNANMQRVQNVRDLLVLLAEDDHFRQDVQQNPKIMLAYLAALGDNTLKNTEQIILPSKEEVRNALQSYDFASEHTIDIVKFDGWGSWSSWAAWVFVFLAPHKTSEQTKLN